MSTAFQPEISSHRTPRHCQIGVVHPFFESHFDKSRRRTKNRNTKILYSRFYISMLEVAERIPISRSNPCLYIFPIFQLSHKRLRFPIAGSRNSAERTEISTHTRAIQADCRGRFLQRVIGWRYVHGSWWTWQLLGTPNFEARRTDENSQLRC